jgi:CBS domain containing-hemolysin-like protein
LPKVGETFEFRGLRFEVLEADERRVARVRIRPLEAAESVESPDANAAVDHAEMG